MSSLKGESSWQEDISWIPEGLKSGLTFLQEGFLSSTHWIQMRHFYGKAYAYRGTLLCRYGGPDLQRAWELLSTMDENGKSKVTNMAGRDVEVHVTR